MRLFKLENIYYNAYLDEEGKKMSGDLFISLNITGWSAGCRFLGPFLCDSDYSASVRIGLVSSVAATQPPDQAESEKTRVKAERDMSLKVARIKFQLPVGRVSRFRAFSITFASGSTNLMTTGKEIDWFMQEG